MATIKVKNEQEAKALSALVERIAFKAGRELSDAIDDDLSTFWGTVVSLQFSETTIEARVEDIYQDLKDAIYHACFDTWVEKKISELLSEGTL